MKVTKTHKDGNFTVQLTLADQGRLSEISCYYSITQKEAMVAIIFRGLASILMQTKEEKATTRVNRFIDTKDTAD